MIPLPRLTGDRVEAPACTLETVFQVDEQIRTQVLVALDEGRQVALQLCAVGMPRLTLFDSDSVTSVTLSSAGAGGSAEDGSYVGVKSVEKVTLDKPVYTTDTKAAARAMTSQAAKGIQSKIGALFKKKKQPNN